MITLKKKKRTAHLRIRVAGAHAQCALEVLHVEVPVEVLVELREDRRDLMATPVEALCEVLHRVES